MPAVWYHAIPQVGAVLFLAGWWAALRADGFGRFTRGQAAGILSFVVVFSASIRAARLQIIGLTLSFCSERSGGLPDVRAPPEEGPLLQGRGPSAAFTALAHLDRVDRILARAGAARSSCATSSVGC